MRLESRVSSLSRRPVPDGVVHYKILNEGKLTSTSRTLSIDWKKVSELFYFITEARIVAGNNKPPRHLFTANQPSPIQISILGVLLEIITSLT